MADLHCRVTPNAKRSEILGWEQDDLGRDVLRIKLNAPPLEGKANRELIRFLAQKLTVSKSTLALLRGDKSRAKTVRVEGVDLDDLKWRLV